MSITRSVVLFTYTSTDPLVPAGMIPAFAVIAPVRAFNVDANGCTCPVGHAVRYPSGPLGTAVKFNEYACAEEGTLQELESTGKVRLWPPPREGPPSGPMGCRVSATRQGVSG